MSVAEPGATPPFAEEDMGERPLAAHWRRLRRKAGSEGVRAVAFNTGWVLLEKVGRALVSALVSAWVARYLGPTRFASIAYGLAIATFLVPLAQLGLTTIVVRDLVREPDKAPLILGTTLLLRGIAGLACFLLAILFLFASEPSPEGRLVGALIAAQLLFQASDAIDYWFQSRLESRIGVTWRMLVTFAVAALKVALILLNMPLWTFALAISLETALVALAMAIAYHRHPLGAAWGRSRQIARALLREGSLFLVAAIAIAIYLRIDQLLIRHMLGPTELGLYAAVIPLSQVWQIIPASLITSLGPVMAQRAQEGEEAFHRALRMMFLLVGGTSLALSVGLALVAPLIVRLILGGGYAEAIPALQIYLFTNLFVALGVAWNVWVATSGRGILLVINTIAASCVSVIANLLLIPRLGIVGAAIAANLSLATAGLLMNIFTCRDIFLLQLGIVRKPKVSPSSAPVDN